MRDTFYIIFTEKKIPRNGLMKQERAKECKEARVEIERRLRVEFFFPFTLSLSACLLFWSKATKEKYTHHIDITSKRQRKKKEERRKRNSEE